MPQPEREEEVSVAAEDRAGERGEGRRRARCRESVAEHAARDAVVDELEP